jgi:hypothetical protein
MRLLFTVAIFIIGLFLTLCSCDPDRGIETADIHKVYNQDKALFLAEVRFEERFGVHTDAYKYANVIWTDTPCPYADGNAVIYEGECYHGLMFGCDEMYVAIDENNPNRTCGTALMHEFGHCLWARAGKGFDGDHENPALWGFVKDVKKETCDRDW